MRRISVPLEQSEFEALRQMADVERRPVQYQAAYLLSKQIERQAAAFSVDRTSPRDSRE